MQRRGFVLGVMTGVVGTLCGRMASAEPASHMGVGSLLYDVDGNPVARIRTAGVSGVTVRDGKECQEIVLVATSLTPVREADTIDLTGGRMQHQGPIALASLDAGVIGG